MAGSGPSSLHSRAMSLFSFQPSTNSTAALLNDSRYAAAKSIRTSTVILACLNAVAALATAVVIIWDARARRSAAAAANAAATGRTRMGTDSRGLGLGLVRGRDAFPFVLSVGIVVQSGVFAVAQSTGLEEMLVLGCRATSQVMFPAAFIVPYLQLIFGLELAIRSVLPGPFRSPRRWSYAACLVAVVVLLAAHILIAQLIRPPNLCFASLFWFLKQYAVVTFALLISVAGLLFLGTVAVVTRLKRDAKVPLEQRVTASRMVYYMSVAIISNLLLVPFFNNLAFTNLHTTGPLTLQLSLIAAVAANVSGLLTGGLYLFLRSNTLATIGGSSLLQPTRSDSNASNKGFISNPYGNAMAAPTLAPQAFVRPSRPPPFPPGQSKSESTEALVASDEKLREEEAAIESPVMPPPSVYDSVRDSFSTLHSTSTGTSKSLSSPYESRPPLPVVVPLAMGSPAPTTVPLSMGSLVPLSMGSPAIVPLAMGSPVPPADIHDLVVQLDPDEPATPHFSIFPSPRTTAPGTPKTVLPSTTYVPPSTTTTYAPPSTAYTQAPFSKDSLLPPPRSILHRRGSSLVSSATVQIGLRLSNVDDMAPIRARHLQDDAERVYSINGSDNSRLTVPGPPYTMPTKKSPSPLSMATAVNGPRPPSSVYPTDAETTFAMSPRTTYYLSSYYDPPPVSQVPVPAPQSKVPSPKGVGFKVPSPKGVGFNMPPPAPRRPWI